ncbi:DUF6412 domain-containing protein [Microbacterium sp. SLBN-146]|uniref:DUF6412 domain-containing protein n=1 Tax=Microbacterium sp. SLBN-146 TaxID=2768457 RepID=UPI0011530A09|nr:DUF6412 domain-containing protein [Microbacterium sp. SLBN-146]TQJ31257.1 hypothetical protein FBY39_1720 [Microbacterium sp. SLBN-146]
MFESIVSALHLLLSTLGIVGGGIDVTALGGMTGAIALAITLMTVTVVMLGVVAMLHRAPGGTSPPHPQRAIDISSPLTQSDPDAPGHPRPRAPQFVATAT